MEKRRISFFASPIGLGHAARDAAIAAQISCQCTQRQHEVEIRFTSGGAAARLLGDATGSAARDEYSPPRFNVDSAGRLKSPAVWLYRYYRYYMRCKRAAGRIIESESPDIVVSDEDFASVVAAQQAGIRTVLITDVLATRFADRWPGSIIESRMNRSMRSIMAGCDAVIIPEDGKRSGNMYRVGPITRGFAAGRDELRRRYGFSKTTVLVAVGGTDAGMFLIRQSIKAMRIIGRDDVDMAVVAGPSIEESEVAAAGAEAAGARVFGYVPDMHNMIMASDVIVSLAGRSTMDEAAAAGTPAVFVPIMGHFEQEENAAGRGFATVRDAPPDAGWLAGKISRMLDAARAHDTGAAARRHRGIPGGAAAAADLIMQTLQS